MAILGPSGCGKTTLLQMIAGLERPDEGSITIAGETVSEAKENIFLQPEKRQIALVFQNYALWPHYNVFENVAYPLRIRRIKKDKIKKRVAEILTLVKLNGMEKRYPFELSGGEQQRVALARALVMKPRLLLLDEPLSNLDAKLKEEMHYEIKRIQKEVGLTIVHVTHDQYEAMGIADRIVVMNHGKIIQEGRPKEVYDHPQTEFVANFIGTTNLIEGKVKKKNGQRLFEFADGTSVENNFISNHIRGEVILSVRPEEIVLNHSNGIAQGEIIREIYRGNVTEYSLLIGNTVLTVQANNREHYEVGERVHLSIRHATIVKFKD
ncbi:MAG: ABC transporter ATP-binding protein [Halanaerobiales bacterium]|nr:ABC transporter ATP-binding protein [Halanaerobiales bacterium]